MDLLDWLPVDHGEAGAPRFVPFDDLVKTLLKYRDIEIFWQPDADTDNVLKAVWH